MPHEPTDATNIEAPEAAPRKRFVTDFNSSNPDVTIEFRALPSNIQWDWVARTTVLAGEQVDLLNINGQFIRAWVRDNLLEDLSAYAQLTAPFAMFDIAPPFTPIKGLLSAPIGVYEMLLAGWLIVRRFSAATTASVPRRTPTNELVAAA